MRSQKEAQEDAQYHVAQLIDSLQDADSDQQLIENAERLQSEIGNGNENETVKTNPESLEMLVSESDLLLEQIDNPEWMENYGNDLQDAVDEGREAIRSVR